MLSILRFADLAALTDEEPFYWWECIEMLRKFLLCGLLRFIAPESASQVVFGIMFVVLYLAAVALFGPYKEASDDFFQTMCQVVTLLVFIVCMLQLMRRKLGGVYNVIEELDGPVQMDFRVSMTFLTSCAELHKNRLS